MRAIPRSSVRRSFVRFFPSASRPFRVLFGFYALLGLVDAALGVAFETLLSRHALQTSALAGALLWGTALALPLLWFGGRVVARTGARRVLLGVAALVPLLAGALLAAPGAPVFLAAAALLVTVTALLDLGAGAGALALEARRGRALLGRAQAGFAFGAVPGALLGGLLVGGPGEAALALLVAALAALLAAGTRRLPDAAPEEREEGAAPRPVLHSGLALVGLVALAAAFAEGLLSSWGALFLQRDLGASPALAGALGGGYYAAFGVGAVLSTVLLVRLGPRRALAVLLAAAAVGAALLVAAPRPEPAAAGLWLLGAALAGVTPTLLGWAARLGLAAGAAGFVTTFVYAGMLLEPLAVGLSPHGVRPVLTALPAVLGAAGLAALLWGTWRLPLPRPAAPLPAAGD